MTATTATATRYQGYTKIQNQALNDSRLKLKSIGLLCKMIQLPKTTWNFSERGLASLFQNDGIHSLRTALADLEKHGYLYRYQIREENGTFGRWVWEITDTPCSQPKSENPISKNRSAYKSNKETTNSPHTPRRTQRTERVREAKPRRLNAPKRATCASAEEVKAWEAYLSAYPKACPAALKGRARRKLASLVAAHGLEWVLSQVEAYKAHETRIGREPRYWKNAATWLLDGCAEQAYKAPQSAQKRRKAESAPETRTCPICGGVARLEPSGLHYCEHCDVSIK